MHLFNEIDTSEQVHSEIDKLPVNAFLGVRLLFQHEHVMVKELLQLLVGEVDAKLLETVVLNERSFCLIPFHSETFFALTLNLSM